MVTDMVTAMAMVENRNWLILDMAASLRATLHIPTLRLLGRCIVVAGDADPSMLWSLYRCSDILPDVEQEVAA